MEPHCPIQILAESYWKILFLSWQRSLCWFIWAVYITYVPSTIYALANLLISSWYQSIRLEVGADYELTTEKQTEDKK